MHRLNRPQIDNLEKKKTKKQLKSVSVIKYNLLLLRVAYEINWFTYGDTFLTVPLFSVTSCACVCVNEWRVRTFISFLRSKNRKFTALLIALVD